MARFDRANVLKSVVAIVSKSSRSEASGASVSNHTLHGNIKSSRSSLPLSIRGDGHGYASS